jgi:hypothetical protein
VKRGRTKHLFFTMIGFGILIWYTSLFWNNPSWFFAGSIQGDGVLSIYFYKHIANSWHNQLSYSTLFNFSYPVSPTIDEHFPSQTEAFILAPFINELDWPTTWSVITSWSYVINGIGLFVFLRGIGFQQWCIPIACLWSIGLRPTMVDILLGRFNVTTVGYAFLCAGSFLECVNSKKIRPFYIALFLISAIPAIEIYPFFMLFLLPIVTFYIKKYRFKSLPYLLLPMIILLLRQDVLLQIINAEGAQVTSIRHSNCPNPVTTLPLERLLIQDHSEIQRASHGIFWWTWIPLLGLLLSKKHWPLLIYAFLLALITMGPCGKLYWLWPDYDWSFLWETMHDLSRVSIVLVCLPVVGMCVLIQKYPKTGIFLSIPFMGIYLQKGFAETQSTSYWHRTVSSQVLQVEPEYGAMVLLPFDELYQFIYVLEHPQIPLVNPINKISQPRQHPDFYKTLFDLGRDGRTKPNTSRISCTDLSREQISTIVYHPDLCKFSSINENDCLKKLPQTLQATIDVPFEKIDDLHVWHCE